MGRISRKSNVLAEHRYVIIGGATKAGTTSLYFYLADHPEICASNLKETRFFLDAEYPLPAKYRLEDGLDKYEKYFNHCQKQSLRFEATPDYLYSPDTPQKIKHSLPNVKIIFILREPIDRLTSWYRFAKQNGLLPVQMSFDEYIYFQLNKSKRCGSEPQHMRALEQGCYSTYLKPYFDLLERDRLCVLKYETLKKDPNALLTEFCLFAGINPHFYNNYIFKNYNPTRSMRSTHVHRVYRNFVRVVRMRLYDKQRVRAILRFVRRRFEPFYRLLNTRPDEQLVMSDSLRVLLEDYYSDETAALANLLGRETFSWDSLKH